MYVRKFEGDSLEETLGVIKQELGPDAIILKTVTNKGLKGAFKKKRIEITAAISEKSYSKKAKVDSVLTTDQKDKFYQNNSSYISNMINNSDREERSSSAHQAGYGQVALNKSVQAKNIAESSVPTATSSLNTMGSSLDDFLSSGAPKTEYGEEPILEHELKTIKVEEVPSYAEKTPASEMMSQGVNPELESLVQLQKEKIDILEKQIFELSQNLSDIDRPKARGVTDLVSILRSLDIEEKYIQSLVKKVNFGLSGSDLENSDIVLELALKEMLAEIQVSRPLFSKVDNSEAATVTVVVSDITSGQSSMLTKIASLQEGSTIIRNKGDQDFKDNKTFSEKFFDIKIQTLDSVSEIVQETRKIIENNQNVFIDYKAGNQEANDIKNFLDGLRRSFKNVEVLVCLSSINSELYNKKVLNRYSRVANGIVVTHLDQCLNYGALFNIAINFPDLPYQFFGTGEIVPDDLEGATAERILAGIFQL